MNVAATLFERRPAFLDAAIGVSGASGVALFGLSSRAPPKASAFQQVEA